MPELKQIPTDQLKPHPDNPRLVLREDVIEGIVAQLKESKTFSEMHAPIVRPLNGHYQIISGHTRHESAKRADIKMVPCWVEEMSDEEASMQLIMANSQAELDVVERAKHIFRHVRKQKYGGLTKYKDDAGISKSYASELFSIGEVFEEANKKFAQANFLLGKGKHLLAVSKSDRSLWMIVIEAMDRQQWSSADTAHWVEKINKFDIPKKWEKFLPLPRVILHFLKTKEFSPATVAKLIELAESTEKLIKAYGHVIDADLYLKAYHEWLYSLDGDKTPKTWDARELTRRQRELMVEFEQAEIEAENRWNYGDWRGFVGELEDETVSLLLTDPPYGIAFKSDHKLDRRQERRHKEIINDSPDAAIAELGEMLNAFLPKMSANSHALIFCHWSNEPEVRAAIEDAGLQIRGSLVWVKNNTGMGDPSTTFAPQHERIIHAVKGSPVLLRRASDVLNADRVQSSRHPTEKPIALLSALIEATTTEGELVADPFAGVASTLVAAKMLKRDYWGCEIVEEYFNAGRERLEAGE
jgi:site-specific DNA-methyltransferase (adenine-specific)